MNRCRVLLISTLFLLTNILFSLDYGISIDESISLNSADLSNNIKTAAWVNLEQGVNKFEAKGFLNFNTATDIEFPTFMDLDLLKFSSQFKKSSPELPDTKFILGRWPIGDQTGYILAHKLDGVYFNFKYPVVTMYTNLAYSGLLWKQSSGISPSALDSIYSGDHSVILGSPRAIGIMGFIIPPIYKQSLSLELVYQVDMRDKEYVIDEFQKYALEGDQPILGAGMLDTYYASLKITGAIPLLTNFNYKVTYAFNGGSSLSSVTQGLDFYKYSDIYAHLAEVKLDKYIPLFYNSLISYRFVYSSGDRDYNGYTEGNFKGNATNFLPITRSGFGAVFSPSLGNLIVNDLSFSLKPMGSLQTVTKVLLFTRSTTGPISEDGIDPSSNNLFLGTEVDVTANYRPFSDLGISLTAGFYFPSPGVYNSVYLEDNSVQTSIRLNISFSI